MVFLFKLHIEAYLLLDLAQWHQAFITRLTYVEWKSKLKGGM